MAVVVCVTPFGTLRPGDEAEVPSGAEVSGEYFADLGSAAAMRAAAEAAAGSAAPVADDATLTVGTGNGGA